MAYKVGLSVEEATAKGFTSFVEPSKRNVGVAMARTRGVANKPFLLPSLEEDRVIFGGYLAGAYGYAVMKNLFRNSRGYSPTIYGCRIVGAGCEVATGVISLPFTELEGFAAYEGAEDVGSWGNDLTVILYPKGIRISGKWYMEVTYKGSLVESYSSVNLKEIVEATASSKYVYFTSTNSIANEATNNVAITFVGTIKVGVSGTMPDNLTFELPNTYGALSPVGYVFVDSFGNKIGEVASYDPLTFRGTFQDVALINGNLTGVKYLEDVAYLADFSAGVYVAPTESDFYGRTTDQGIFGLDVFSKEDVQIVANTEFHTKSMAIEGGSFAALNDMLYVFNLPEEATRAIGQDFATTLQTGTISHLAGYHGWVKTIVDDVNYGYVPMIGCVIGAGYIRATAMQGDFIHIPPGGTDSAFTDIVEVKNGKLSQQEIDLFVQTYTINVVKYQKGLGYFLVSSRTMSSNALYHSIHIRLQTSFYKRVLRENFNWVLQKPNTPELKRSIKGACYSYFKTEYNNGALENSVDFETACNIIIDNRNNPASQDRKLLNLDIDWIPTEATEAFRISLNRNDGQLLLNEGNLN